MLTTRENSFPFLKLPLEAQLAIIQQMGDDQTLFRFLSANSYTWHSLFKCDPNLIFKSKTQHITRQRATNSFLIYKDYAINSRRISNGGQPYVNEVEENHTALSYMTYKGYEKSVSKYLSQLQDREELKHTARRGYNLLVLAILSNNPAMIDLILSLPEASDYIYQVDDYSDLPIHHAARVGNRAILKSLMEFKLAFEIDLMPMNEHREPGKIYLEKVEQGYRFEIIGSDGERLDKNNYNKTSIIQKNTLPECFQNDLLLLIRSRKELLQVLSQKYSNMLGDYCYSTLRNFCYDCPRDDVDFLNDLIKCGAETCVEYPPAHFLEDPLYIAIIKNKPKVADILFDLKKSNIEKFIPNPRLILECAIKHRHANLAKKLVGCEIPVNNDPYNSLLKKSLALADTEFSRFAFNIESNLYQNIPEKIYDYENRSVMNSPVFSDYLLEAAGGLFSSPANPDSLKMYQFLVELGFNTSMTGCNSGNNIFHLLANQIYNFLGNSEENIIHTKRFIDTLLTDDKEFNFRNKINKRGATPVAELLSPYNAIAKHLAAPLDTTLPFDELLKIVVANKNVIENVNACLESFKNNETGNAHDDYHRSPVSHSCTIS